MIGKLFEENPELGEGVTAVMPLGRVGEPVETTDILVWLCSDHESFVTGQRFAVDGAFAEQ